MVYSVIDISWEGALEAQARAEPDGEGEAERLDLDGLYTLFEGPALALIFLLDGITS